MTLVDFLLMLLIAGICGALARMLVGYSHGGCLASIAVGFVGALIGTWLARVSGVPELLRIELAGTTFPIVWTVVGAVLFAGLLSLLTRRNASHKP